MKFGNEFWLILFREFISPNLFAVQGTRSKSTGGLCTQNSSILCTHAVPGGVGDIGPLCGIRGPGANPLGVSVPIEQFFTLCTHAVPGGVRDISPLCGIRGPGANPLGVSVPRAVLHSVQIKRDQKWCCDITVESATAT